MLALRVTVPVACFRKGFAREFWETEDLPPPATCYGFLLSFVGEFNRRRHIGARVCPALLNKPDRSAVLRTLWRFKSKTLGAAGNQRPDFQELLTNIQLGIWVDSADESAQGPTLEQRITQAFDHPHQIERQGALCMGESTHMVDEVTRFDPSFQPTCANAYLLDPHGRLTLPIWVDHVGGAGTRYVVGNLEKLQSCHPPRERMPRIEPH